MKKGTWEQWGEKQDWCQRSEEKGGSFNKKSFINNVQSMETFCKIRIKKGVLGVTLESTGDLDESSYMSSRRQKPDLSDFENKWQLSWKRWQPLRTFQKDHLGRNQRDTMIVKSYLGFKEEVAWVGFRARRESVGRDLLKIKEKQSPWGYWVIFTNQPK